MHLAEGRSREAGRVSVFVAATMPAMLLFLALMWDASGYLRALHRADAVAAEAARAAGQAVDLPLAMTGQRIEVNPDAARAAAETYLAEAGLADSRIAAEVRVVDGGRQVEVTVEVHHDALLLPTFGVGTPETATAHARAHLVDG